MTNITLLEDEKVLLSSDENVLVLTNKRVRYDFVRWGQSNLIGITLDSVASCGLSTKSSPWLLIIAAIAAIAALNQVGEPRLGLFVFAAVFVGAYFFTRKSVISIASNGGKEILAPVEGMSRDGILKFIETVEREKLKQVSH